MASVHLHQVRPLQGNAQVQVTQKQSDQTNARVPDIYAQRHGGVSVTTKKQKNLIIQPFMTDFFVSLHSKQLLWSVTDRFHFVGTEALRFCLVHRIWKIQTRARRSATVHVYTWACRLMLFS